MTSISAKPVALVTGASSGIGLATAHALTRAGYLVFGTSRGEVASVNGPIRMLRCDVTDDRSVADAVQAVVDGAGRIDLLVNNAGLGMAGPAEETSMAQARDLFEVNFFGTVRVVLAVLPHMRAAKRGRILNISSVFGLIPAPYMAIYAATKHAVEGYTESLDHEVRGWGIRAIAIEPANTRTSFDANLVPAANPLSAYDDVRARIKAMLQGMAQTGDDPAVVADTIVKAAGIAKPDLRYAAGKGRKLTLLRRFVPRQAFDASLRKQLGLSAS